MTSNKKLQVFISSTYIDMIEERQAIVEAILKAGHIPAGMELFKSNDQSQFEIIKRWIDDSDVFVLIIGGRYGTVDEESGKSYIELEYDYAVEKNKNRFTIQITDKYLDEKLEKALGNKKTSSEIKEDRNVERFRVFKEKVGGSNKHTAFYSGLIELKYELMSHIKDVETSVDNLIGWVRGDMARSVESVEEMVRLMKENEELKGQLKEDTIEDLIEQIRNCDFKVILKTVQNGNGTFDEIELQINVISYLSYMKELLLQFPTTHRLYNTSTTFFSNELKEKGFRKEDLNSEDYSTILEDASKRLRDILIGNEIIKIGTSDMKPICEPTEKGQKLLSKLHSNNLKNIYSVRPSIRF